MLHRILLSVLIGFVLTTSLMAQTNSKSKNQVHYRVLMTSINIEDLQPDEISISLNAFNTGRKPIDLSEFNSVPAEMEIKFEESFYRSSLSGLENEILSGLLNKNIVIPNGKILRNIRFNLPNNPSLYKQLTKSEKRYTKNYTPKKRNNKSAALKYKTSDKKLNPPPSFIANNKRKKGKNKSKNNEDKIAATINKPKINTNKPTTPKTNIPNPATAGKVNDSNVRIERKEKEMEDLKRKELELKDKEREALKMKEREIANLADKEKARKELELKNKEMEALKIKEKEIADVAKKERARKELELKNKEMEKLKIKEKEMAELDRKEKTRKELELKNQKMKELEIKEKEIVESNISDDTSESPKKEKLSIIERQKLKRKEREEAKQNEYKIEKASQKEDEKAILESLGVGKSKDKSKSGSGIAFDTKASVEASKNSYAEKAICPDLVLSNIDVVKKSKNWVTLEYTLTNVGKGPAYLGKDNRGQGLALRAFLSSSENISRGALPLGGGFVNYDDKKNNELNPENSFTGSIKLDIRKMTRFTPFVIINFDPFNVLEECDKTNNYGNVKIGG